jgi:hypothetical protein
LIWPMTAEHGSAPRRRQTFVPPDTKGLVLLDNKALVLLDNEALVLLDTKRLVLLDTNGLVLLGTLKSSIESSVTGSASARD